MSENNFEIGLLLGRRQAFGAVAGKCAAAEVAQMKEIRDRKLYLDRAADWQEFCLKELQTTKDSANRLIRYLEEFGPAYFMLTQFTKISPETYRAIAPTVEEDELRWNGEAIALIPENAGKVTAAIAEMRKTVTVKPVQPLPAPTTAEELFPVLERECSELASKLERAIELTRHRSAYMRAVVLSLRDRLNRLEMTI